MFSMSLIRFGIRKNPIDIQFYIKIPSKATCKIYFFILKYGFGFTQIFKNILNFE